MNKREREISGCFRLQPKAPFLLVVIWPRRLQKKERGIPRSSLRLVFLGGLGVLVVNKALLI
jgi:hypothetical protein